MSDDDLFGGDSDSDDTAELVATSKKSGNNAATAANKKKKAAAGAAAAGSGRLKKKTSKPAAGTGGKKPAAKKSALDDSDDDDDNGGGKKPSAAGGDSKRAKLEALAKKRQQATGGGGGGGNDAGGSGGGDSSKKRSEGAAAGEKGKKNKDGYESEESFDSAEFVRTKEDDDFLDTTGEDPDAVQELYAAQHFDDEEADEDRPKKKKRKINFNMSDDYGGSGYGGGGGSRADNPDRVEGVGGDVEPDNPILAAVHRMKKKKQMKKGLTEIEDESKEFLARMEAAAEADEQAIAERKPATRKLAMLGEVVDMLTKKDMQRMLLDLDLLAICKRWIQPLPGGTLGNVTIRQRLLEAIGNMTGDTGVTAADLKRSEFGKTVMVLFKHPKETPGMKRQLHGLIEQWSRPIFQKSGNMKDLERVSATRGEGGLAAMARQQQFMQQQQQKQQQRQQQQQSDRDSSSPGGGGNDDELQAMLTSGKKSGPETGTNRVRVPFSKGFAFSVRPQAKAVQDVSDSKRNMAKGGGGPGGAGSKDIRANLAKRMTEKARKVGKNQRSANISVEGRPTKG